MWALPASPVAVLIVNYKSYDELDAALSSLAPALRDTDEVLVFDQESAPARVAALAHQHPRVRWIVECANVGFAAGINRAAKETRSPYLLWLNPDTRVEGDAVQTLAAWLDGHPDVGSVGPRVLNADGSLQQSARRFPSLSTAVAGRSTWLTRRFPHNPWSRRNLLASASGDPIPVDWLAGSCLMTRRSLFDRLGGLDEGFFMYWEDADYAKRAATLGASSVYVPAATVGHAGGRSASHSPDRAIRAFHQSAYRVYRKHAGPFGRLIAPLVRIGLWARGELKILGRRVPQRGR